MIYTFSEAQADHRVLTAEQAAKSLLPFTLEIIWSISSGGRDGFDAGVDDDDDASQVLQVSAFLWRWTLRVRVQTCLSRLIKVCILSASFSIIIIFFFRVEAAFGLVADMKSGWLSSAGLVVDASELAVPLLLVAKGVHRVFILSITYYAVLSRCCHEVTREFNSSVYLYAIKPIGGCVLYEVREILPQAAILVHLPRRPFRQVGGCRPEMLDAQIRECLNISQIKHI